MRFWQILTQTCSGCNMSLLPCPSSAVPLQTMEQGLERGWQMLSDKLLTNCRSNFPGINCHSDKWRWNCHVSTRQHCEKNHKGLWSTWILQEQARGDWSLCCTCVHGEDEGTWAPQGAFWLLLIISVFFSTGDFWPQAPCRAGPARSWTA